MRNQRRQQQQQQQQECRCPFFVALLREVQKCRMFFLDNEAELKVKLKLRVTLHM